MEAPEPLLEATVVGIDVVDVKLGRARVGFTGLRQDVGRDAGLSQAFRWHANASKRGAGEGNNRSAAVAAEFVVGRDDPVQHRGDGHPVQFGSTASVVAP